MKLSNKILIAAFSLMIVLTFITMIKVKSIHNEFKQNETFGNKNWLSVEFPLQEFTSLKVGEHFEVKWHKGTPMVKVRIEENIKSFFKVNQDGAKVEIKFDSLSSYHLNGAILVDVYSQTLSDIKLEDFVQFATLDTILANELKIELEDHCDAEIWTKAESMDLHQYDFTELKLKGQVNKANIKLGDHSNLSAEQLEMTTVVMDMNDFVEASILVRSHLKVECQDHANLEYRGDSVSTEIIQRDFSEVSKER